MYLYMYISSMQSFRGDWEILQSWQSKDALSETRKRELEEARKEGATGLRGMTMAFETHSMYVWIEYTKMWPVWNAVEGQSSKQMKTFEGGLWWDEKEGGGKGYGPRYAFFLYYLNYHKDNKKSFGCPELKSSSRAKCKDWEPATLNFLFLYVFFTFLLSFYLSSALISLLSPTSRWAKEQ